METQDTNQPRIILKIDEEGNIGGFVFIAKSEKDEILLYNSLARLCPCFAGVSL
jgi:hypothetical protein